MAGMLPGVEAARRRRLHQTSSSSISSISNSSDGATTPRRPSLSLFSSNSSTLSSSLVQQRSRPHHESADDDNDEKLGQVARQAKSRLDHRLRALTKSTTTTSTIERHVGVGVGVGVGEMRELTTHVYDGLNKKNKKKKGWWKKAGGGWKGVEQRECAVCLEDFKLGDQLLNMPCAHTFHSNCLVPWLHTNTHCPCCRTSLFS